MFAAIRRPYGLDAPAGWQGHPCALPLFLPALWTARGGGLRIRGLTCPFSRRSHWGVNLTVRGGEKCRKSACPCSHCWQFLLFRDAGIYRCVEGLRVFRVVLLLRLKAHSLCCDRFTRQVRLPWRSWMGPRRGSETDLAFRSIVIRPVTSGALAENTTGPCAAKGPLRVP